MGKKISYDYLMKYFLLTSKKKEGCIYYIDLDGFRYNNSKNCAFLESI